MNPHRLLLGLLLTASCVVLQARPMMSSPAPEGYGLQLEVVSEDIGMLVGALGVTDLTGYSCTRLYVEMNNADDFMSSVSGDAINPTYINTTTSYYHAVLGGATPNGINSLLFAVYPDLAYDSWVTIGLEGVPNVMAGEANVSSVQSTVNPWSTNFDPGAGLPGGSIAIDDIIGGAWYALNGDANGVAGDDLKVLIGQFTTTGELSGQVYCQVFINGDGMNEFRDTFFFGPTTDIEGCTDITACNFNEEATSDDGSCAFADEGYDCDGNCLADADEDGICDPFEVAGCTDITACNYEASATDDNGSCTYADPGLDCSGNCLADADGDGICDADEVPGCTDTSACNYNAAATDDDASCEYTSCAGCVDVTACNYDDSATVDDGSCTYADSGYDCDGNCLADADNDGVCDPFEVPGCTDAAACNFDASATDDNGSCTYADPGLDCNGNCLSDADGDGICDENEIAGCTDQTACNFDASATDDDASCTYADPGYDCDGNCLADSDGDGICDAFDPCDNPDLEPTVLPLVPATLVATVSLNGEPVTGLTVIASVDGETVGVDEAFDFEGLSWISMSLYVETGDEVEFQLFDAAECALYELDLTLTVETEGDELGTFNDPGDLPFLDDDAVLGCTDAEACNYDGEANVDDDSCTYPDAGLDCDGNCLNDADLDGVCDENEVNGCDDDTACNYDENATDNDGSCTYPDAGLDCDGNCLNDADQDGICDEDETTGCTDAAACNYSANATDSDPSLCIYPEEFLDCNGNCLNDTDGDGICNENEVAGCSDASACNFDANATDDDGSCTYAEPGLDCNGNCLADADGDGICDGDEIAGCQDMAACNFDEEATDEDGSCTYADAGYDCAGNCLADEDGDGICDEFDPCNEPNTTPVVSPLIPVQITAIVTLDDQPAIGYTVIATVNGVTVGSGVTFSYDSQSWVTFNAYAGEGDDISLSLFDGAACALYDLGYEIEVDDEGEELGSFEDPETFPFYVGELIEGCQDEAACNYNPDANLPGLCEYPIDVFGVDYYNCDGSCVNDANNNGICDEDEVLGCTELGACNYNGAANVEDGSCVYPIDLYGLDYVDCGGACLNDADGNGICDEVQLDGCTDTAACNYDSTANTDDGSCDFTSCAGCTDPLFCNYDADATLDDGSCLELDECGVCGGDGIAPGACDCDGNVEDALGICGGDCAADEDGDGLCDDEDDCVGILDECGVCNGPGLEEGYDCDGNCLEDEDSDGICDFEDPCLEPDTTVTVLPLIPTGLIAQVYLDGAAIFDATVIAQVDGNTVGIAETFEYEGGSYINMSIYAEAGDEISFILWDAETCFQIGLGFTLTATEEGGDLGTFDDQEDLPFGDGDGIEGCLDEAACNYNELATIQAVTCVYPEQFCGADYFDCDCECLTDVDNDGICDEEEVPGCGDPLACNYDADATDFFDALCTYPASDFVDCDGVCLNDADGDEVCDEEEILGCTDDFACNYDADATEEDGSCTYPEPGFDCNGDPLLLDDCDPDCFVIDDALDSYTVQCEEDLLALECAESPTVYNGCTGDETVATSCVSLPTTSSHTTGIATTAMGVGPDGAIRVYGLQMQGVAASDYFIETGEGLAFSQYDNGTAVLEGEVANNVNPDQRFQVYLVFEDGMSGAEWGDLGKGFKYIYTCDSIPTDDWEIYTLKNDQSYLEGLGDFEGSLLTLNHAPVNEHFGFQVGLAANDHNCNFGLGGWFAWEGTIGGIPVFGALGDVIVDLEMSSESVEFDEMCVTNVYTFIDPVCGAFNVEQEICRYDTIAPIFPDCPEETTISCLADLPTPATMVAVDNCNDPISPIVTLLDDEIIEQSGTGCFTVSRTWQAEDLFGNIGACTQLIHVVDTVAPSIELTLPGDLTVSVDGACAAQTGVDMTGTASATYDDACGLAEGSITHEDAVVDFISDGCYTIERTWTATAEDDCGNIGTASGVQIIQVADGIAPAITLSNVQESVACDIWSCDLDMLVDLGFVSWNDNCGIDTAFVTCAPASGGCVDLAPTWDLEYTVIDACGNTSTASQFILMVDTVAPTIDIVCPADVVVELDADCMGELDPSQSGEVSITSTDNCDASPTLSYTIEDSAPEYTCADGVGTYVITRTFYAVSTDHCGNTAEDSCTQVLTVQDVTAPVISLLECPEDVTLALDADCMADTGVEALGMPTVEAQDGCDAAPAIEVFYMDGPVISLCDDSDGSADGSYSFERTFYAYATDACGNVGDTAMCVQTITAADQAAPVFGDFPPYEPVSCELLTDPLDPTQVPLDVFDNCDSDLELSIEAWPLSGSCPGSWMRVWTATDDCGNVAMAEQYLALFDNTDPVITCPADTILVLDQDIADDTTTTALGMAEAMDNCSAWSDIDIVYTDSDFTVDCEGDDDQPEGTMTFIRTFTASDFCDNTASCIQTITLIDTLGPMVSVEDVTVSCLDYDAATSFGAFAAEDNFDTDVAHSWEEDSVYAQLCTGSFTVARTWTFVDDCGNETQAHQTITVVDETAPIVTAGELNVSISCEDYSDENTEENVFIDVMDECGSEVSITFFDTPFSGGCVQPVGMYMRTYTFEDDCGNANMFEQIIELFDETPPTIELACPADTVVSADAACAADLSIEALGFVMASATDNCGGAPLLDITWQDHDTVETCAGSFSFERTFTVVATDNCGNVSEASCTQNIGQEDITAPEFQDPLPQDMTVPCFDIPAVADITALDGCDDAPVVTFSEEILGLDECPGTQTLVRTWTATDACGNSSSHSQTIQVTDEFAPEWVGSLPGDTTVSCDAIPAAAVLTATDNCDDNLEVIYAENAMDGDCAQEQTIVRTWSTIDCAGNQIMHMQTISVVDTVAPVIEGPIEVEMPCDEWGVDTLFATVSDNCDATVELSILSDNEFSGSCAGSYLRTYVATDACGNSDTLIQTINLVDTEAPVFTFIPQDTTLSCDHDYTVGSLGAAEAIDNCDSEVEISYTDSVNLINDCPGTAEVVRIWTALDECGNNKTVEQTIVLIDQVAPMFNESLPADMTVSCDAVPNADGLTATDNCDPNVMVMFEEVLSDDDACPHNYTLTRTWSVADCAGNEESHVQTITVVDTAAPAFLSGPADMTVSCDAVPAPADLFELQATDNCDDALNYGYLGETFQGGDCADGYQLTREWSVTDCAGNASTWTQVITVIDTLAPELNITFANGLAAHDTTVSCMEDAPMLEATSNDACDESPFLQALVDTTDLDDCGNATITYSYMTADDCGNMAQASIVITVLDEQAPTWVDVCGLGDGEVVEVCAEDYTGGILLPETAPCDVMALDNCGGDVSLELETTSIGEYAPNDSVVQYCTTETPAAFDEGETCNGYETHAVRMFNFVGGEFYSTMETGLVSQLPNGDWLIEETVVDNSNPNAGWHVAFTLSDGMDYETWSDQDFPTSYKLDCDQLMDDHENWTYWFLSSGAMTGWGDYDGSFLSCTHQPANQYYRFQVGLGANNMNEHHGYSGWFVFSGMHQNTPVMGSGDFFGDLDCTLPYQIEYDYTATDCSGNAAEFGYTVNVIGEVCDPDGVETGLVDGGSPSAASDMMSSMNAAEARGPIQVSHVVPNPTQDFAQIGFNVLQAMRIEVALHDASGMLIANLYNGQVDKGQSYTLDIPASTLESGVYQIRISSREASIVKQFMVTE